MAWTEPPDSYVGRPPTSDDFNDISDDLAFLHGAPSCLFTRTAAGQTVANGNEANLVFPDTLIDTDSMWASNTDIEFTTGGLYLVGFTAIRWNANATGRRHARFRAAGKAIQDLRANLGASVECGLSASGLVRVTGGDGGVVGVFQMSGGNLDLASGHLTFAHWVSG